MQIQLKFAMAGLIIPVKYLDVGVGMGSVYLDVKTCGMRRTYGMGTKPTTDDIEVFGLTAGTSEWFHVITHDHFVFEKNLNNLISIEFSKIIGMGGRFNIAFTIYSRNNQPVWSANVVHIPINRLLSSSNSCKIMGRLIPYTKKLREIQHH